MVPGLLRLFCCFCGSALRRERRTGRLACPGCRARFRVEQDPEGCVIGLEVAGCGTPACCRQAG
ncbi:MAG: hypothetical protein HY002_17090 [Candidatus Rokubacteria bacterium]|nr:hypothetical protein [Candidatus Rokubacteria bacterium]